MSKCVCMHSLDPCFQRIHSFMCVHTQSHPHTLSSPFCHSLIPFHFHCTLCIPIFYRQFFFYLQRKIFIWLFSLSACVYTIKVFALIFVSVKILSVLGKMLRRRYQLILLNHSPPWWPLVLFFGVVASVIACFRIRFE